MLDHNLGKKGGTRTKSGTFSREKTWFGTQYRQSESFNRSRHDLESSTDSQEAVGRFDRSKHGLEPSTDCQEAVGHF